jgi:serine/threonine protein kinase
LAEKGFRQRFEREIQQLISFTHPHIVGILAQGVHDHVPYFVINHLGGGSLSERLKSGDAQDLEAVLGWARQIAQALDFIHGQGVVHRDVKPANILFDDHGHVYLSDFGIAKAIGEAEVDATRLTTTGAGIGSPTYMAPEQGLGLELVPATDQYALAATIYEALGGRPPFEGGTPMQLLVKKSQEAPPHLLTRVPSLSQGAADAVMRALDRDPAKRFPSCVAFLEALARVGSPAAPPHPPRRRVVRVRCRRDRLSGLAKSVGRARRPPAQRRHRAVVRSAGSGLSRCCSLWARDCISAVCSRRRNGRRRLGQGRVIPRRRPKACGIHRRRGLCSRAQRRTSSRSTRRPCGLSVA